MGQRQLWHLLISIHFFVVILLQMNCIKYTSVAVVIYFFNSGNINHQSFADTSSYNIRKTTNTYACGMSGVCHWIEEGNREERKKVKGKEFQVYRIGFGMEVKTK
jgi:hypothetical protein